MNMFALQDKEKPNIENIRGSKQAYELSSD
jgi:hypothetical protein